MLYTDSEELYTYLLNLLYALDGVHQDPRYHPEGDALFHSLQTFEVARRESDDPGLHAAALFHDIGKATDPPNHAEIGATAMIGVLAPRYVWLIRHHMDLCKRRSPVRKRLFALCSPKDLSLLRTFRKWDLAGRKPRARVLSPERAVQIIVDQALLPNATFAATHVALPHASQEYP